MHIFKKFIILSLLLIVPTFAFADDTCTLIFKDGTEYTGITHGVTNLFDGDITIFYLDEYGDRVKSSNPDDGDVYDPNIKRLNDLVSINGQDIGDGVVGAEEVSFECSDTVHPIKIGICLGGYKGKDKFTIAGEDYYARCIKESGGSVESENKGVFGKLDKKLDEYFDKSYAWKNDEGKFNTARLISDSVAGVVLGTVGGVVTSKIMKKHQIKDGFETLRCTIGGQTVASYGDEFNVSVVK